MVLGNGQRMVGRVPIEILATAFGLTAFIDAIAIVLLYALSRLVSRVTGREVNYR